MAPAQAGNCVPAAGGPGSVPFPVSGAAMNSASDPRRTEEGVLTGAIARLNQALDRLEAAVDARIEREESLADTEAEVQRMGADRTRLAESLDNAEARASRLEAANREVSRRLVDAMEAIRAVLDRPASHENRTES